MNWPTAIARLMLAMPSPVAVLSGETNRASAWRPPMVIISTGAASRTTGQKAWVTARDWVSLISVVLGECGFETIQGLVELCLQIGGEVAPEPGLQRQLRLAPLCLGVLTKAFALRGQTDAALTGIPVGRLTPPCGVDQWPDG